VCGIAGIWGTSDDIAVRQMMDAMVHRGPDDAGTYSSDSGGVLGHRRLSIMDPAGGHQPIERIGDDCAIVANGEIYNFPQLRVDLANRHRFRTRSDSEAALHLYRDAGVHTAKQLDGMFALAIADGEELYLARDPLGIKPLYYGQHAGGLAFASELKALVGHAEDVREFPPGTWFHSRHGFQRYYEVPDGSPMPGSLTEHLRNVRAALEQAVVKRLMSDVPVGAFLSGGLDSSIIAAIARLHIDELHTFSVGIEGSRDIQAARLVARHLGTVHHEYILTPDEVLAALPEIIYFLESFDQDLVRSAIPCYFTSRLASTFVKVILTGEGADELFAGYEYYRTITCPRQLDRELRRSVSSLHNINLQRVDRLTMAHSIEGRVPFLDLDLIEVAQSIPPELKLFKNDNGQIIEKWVLRKAFEDLLPSDIVWRDKEQFDEGSGTTEILADVVGCWMTTHETEQYTDTHRASRLRSLEECVYHKLLVEAFPRSSCVLGNVARWSERPELSPRTPAEVRKCR
jgi:asparagine synthase (glutamine-hydrolysing)